MRRDSRRSRWCASASGHYPGARVDEVFSAVYVPVCSPRLLKGEHPLRRPEDLRYHTLLHDDTVIDEGARPSWGDWLQIGRRDRHRRHARPALQRRGARAGCGHRRAWASRSRSSRCSRTEIEARRLAVPFDIAAPTGYSYYLVTPEAAAENAAVSSSATWLLAEAARERALIASRCA